MNKLNPLYILFLILTCLFISFLKVNDISNEHNQLVLQSKTIKIKANDFAIYKQTWFNKDAILKKINSIISNSSFRKEKIVKKEYKDKISIRIKSSNPKILNKFLNRVLNEKFIINKLDIKKTSIFFEIGVK